MKTDTRAVARALGLHPAELLVRLWNHRLVHAIEDCLPEIDEGMVATFRQLEGLPPPLSAPPAAASSEEPSLAQRILCVMHKRQHWGHNRIGEDQLKKHLPSYNIDPRRLHKSLRELVQSGILQQQDKGYSLDTGKKAEVEAEVERWAGTDSIS